MGTEIIFTIVVLGLAMVTIVLLGTVVLLRDVRNRLHQSFFGLALASAMWVVTNLIFAVIDDNALQYSIALLSYGAAGLLALFFLRYCLLLAKIKVKGRTLVALTLIGLAVSFASSLPDVVGYGVTVDNRVQTHPVALGLYGLYLIGFMGAGVSALIWASRHAKGMERNRITIVLTGLVLAAVVGVFFNLLLPFLGNYDFVKVGPVATLILMATSTYAIVRHRLFDIKLAAVRGFAYIGVLLTLSLIYYVLAFLLSTLILGTQTTDVISVGPVNIFMALVLAFAFQPIKRFFDKITNDIFYHDNYNSDDFFAALSDVLTSTVELRGLLERASRQIATTFKSEQASFFVYYQNGRGHHASAGTVGHARLPVHDAHMLDQLAITDPRTIYITDLVSDDPARRMLRSHKVALVMPLRQAEKITGYVLLGDKLTGAYTKRDLSVLSTVSNELVIAIQNALSIHEVKELNATLQQRIDIATKELRSSNAQLKHLDEVKDEFMSMASHQLRTPLTSVKGYISMVVEGDVGKVSPQQQKLLTEAFKSSERMVRLISDFLDVSRLQTGKFVIEKAPFDLVDVVKQEVRDLELMAHAHELKLRLNVRAKGPMIVNADEQKIRQVIMNYIDNAIFYSSAKSTIIINLEQVKHEAALTVVDTGIGVPEDVQARLFTKFFRAPNARQRRPDGTGIGLYLTRRVLNAHDGSIIFSSKEGKGSTFGFRLPIAKNLKVPAPAPEPVVVAKDKTKTNK